MLDHGLDVDLTAIVTLFQALANQNNRDAMRWFPTEAPIRSHP